MITTVGVLVVAVVGWYFWYEDNGNARRHIQNIHLLLYHHKKWWRIYIHLVACNITVVWITIKIVRHDHELYFVFHSFIYIPVQDIFPTLKKTNFILWKKLSHCSAKPHCHTVTPRQTRRNKMSFVSSILPSSISSFWLAMHIYTQNMLHLTCYSYYIAFMDKCVARKSCC